MVFLILLKRKAGFLPAFLSYAKDICPSADILNEITASDAVFAARWTAVFGISLTT